MNGALPVTATLKVTVCPTFARVLVIKREKPGSNGFGGATTVTVNDLVTTLLLLAPLFRLTVITAVPMNPGFGFKTRVPEFLGLV